MSAPRVLLIRVNSGAEIFNTRAAVDAVRRRFPDARLVALATPQTETLDLLRADARLDEVMLFPPEDAGPAAKPPRAFRRFMAGQTLAATVVCFGSTRGFDYRRHLLSALLCPGRRLFLDSDGRMFPVGSIRGVQTLLGAALGLAAQRLALPVLRAFADGTRRRRAPPALADLMASGKVRRILWIRLDHIGDLVMSLPAIQAVKQQFPGVPLDALVLPGSAPILADQPAPDRVITYDAPHLSRRRKWNRGWGLWSLTRRLRRHHYDLAIDLRGDDVSRTLAFLSGARWRVGWAHGAYEPPERANASFLMTHAPSLPGGTRHTVEDNLSLVESLGVTAPVRPFRLCIPEGRRLRVSARLRELGIAGGFVAVHARSGQPLKDWRPERFAAVADFVVRQHDLDVILTGSRDDRDSNAAVLRGVAARARVHDAAGEFSLEELPALYERARLLLTVDTGPMHIAAAVDTPVVALFLPWYADKFHPFGQADAALVPVPGVRGTQPCPDVRGETLLDGLSVAQVTEALDRRLRTARVLRHRHD